MATEWTKEFPQVEGVYWARRTQTNRPEPQAINVWEYDGDWYAYRFGDGRDIEAEDFIKSMYEYLGPVTPSDAEQLSELRRRAQRALKYIETAPVLDDDGIAIVQELRAVLTPQEAKERE